MLVYNATNKLWQIQDARSQLGNVSLSTLPYTSCWNPMLYLASTGSIERLLRYSLYLIVLI